MPGPLCAVRIRRHTAARLLRRRPGRVLSDVMRLVALTCAVLAAAASVVPAAAAKSGALSPYGVVAIVDTGINPYNVVFRDRSRLAQRYPGTYLPGYPKNVPALRLTLDATSYADALRADCDRVWKRVQVGRLYWIPGTKIVGAISFNPAFEIACSGMASSTILDAAGHGTMTASRAVATGYGACPQCRVVSVQAVEDGVGVATLGVDGEMARRGVEWAAANSGWIDAQSNSWGPPLPYDPTGQTGILSGDSALAKTVESASQRQLAFFASGNGAGNLNAPPPRPTLGYAQVTPSAIVVGGVDSGHVLTWPNVPVHLAADACANWGASHDSTTASDATLGGGTSAATPYVAAGAVAELMTARRLLGDRRTGARDGVVARGPAGLVKTGPLADGKLTLAEWRRVLMTTATTRPVAQPSDGPTCAQTVGPEWSALPAAFPEYAAIGYGAVDVPACALAGKVFAGTATMPDRSATDTFFSAYDAVNRAAFTAYTTAP
jgi:hypothetical protein